MALQQEISKNNLQERIGKEYEVLIESISFDGKYYIGRSYMEVPDVDGVIFIKKDRNYKKSIGEFVNCKIIGIQDYDLIE